MGTLLTDYSVRRQRQIQTEDGTMDESEWNKPRWKTEPLLNAAAGKSKFDNFSKAAKFMAFPAIFAAYLLIRTPAPTFHAGSWVGVLVFSAFYMLIVFGGWRQRPRYQKQKPAWQIGGLAVMAGFTLLMCNSPHPELKASTAVSPTAMMVFNAVVVAAYAAFAGILVWKNRQASKAPVQP
jgi:drug/metabolite transporter (DMT)-like permease